MDGTGKTILTWFKSGLGDQVVGPKHCQQKVFHNMSDPYRSPHYKHVGSDGYNKPVLPIKPWNARKMKYEPLSLFNLLVLYMLHLKLHYISNYRHFEIMWPIKLGMFVQNKNKNT